VSHPPDGLLDPARARRLLDVVMSATPLALFELDRDGTVVLSTGAGLGRVAGRPPSTVGLSIFDVYRGVPSVTGPVRRALAGEAFVGTSRVPATDGTEVVFQTTYVPVFAGDGAVERVVGIALDVTEQARAARELDETEGRLRRLALRTQADHEADRRRVAREVHDALGQELTALRFDARAAARRVAAGDAEGALARLAELDGAVDRALGAVQRLASDLRPPSLDERGLRAALDEAARRFGERTGAACTFACSAPDAVLAALPPELETAAFRVAQEALTNVARHADARAVRVELAHEPGRADSDTGMAPSWTLRITVDDDGRGMPAEPGGDSLGLLGMAERAAEWGGALAVRRRPGGGTRVSATFVVPHTGPVVTDAPPDP
jgi:signal transduction histidine kinase